MSSRSRVTCSSEDVHPSCSRAVKRERDEFGEAETHSDRKSSSSSSDGDGGSSTSKKRARDEQDAQETQQEHGAESHMDGSHVDLHHQEIEQNSPQIAEAEDELPTIVLPALQQILLPQPPLQQLSGMQPQSPQAVIQPQQTSIGETKGLLIVTLNECAKISAKLMSSAEALATAAADIRAQLAL